MTDDSADERLAQACFPIRTVAAETGVNAITLRAWERRYGLIRPVRTPSGHRLYSQADIDLVRRVMVLQDKGVPVSRAIAWIRQHPEDGALPPLPAGVPDAGDDQAPTPWTVLRERMLEAVGRFDEYDLETAWNDAVEQYPVDLVIHFLLLPVGHTLRDQQLQTGAGRAAWHFYLAFLRNRLGARYANQTREAQGVRVLLATAPGTASDLGLLLIGIALAQQGLRPLLFAPGIPVAELDEARRRSRARGLLVQADAAPPPALLADLASFARDGLAVFAAGDGLAGAPERLREAGVVALGADPSAAARLVRDILLGA